VPALESNILGNRLGIGSSKTGVQPGGFEPVENLDRLYHRRSGTVDGRESALANRGIRSRFGIVPFEWLEPGQQTVADIGAWHFDLHQEPIAPARHARDFPAGVRRLKTMVMMSHPYYVPSLVT
jgi:hypothetical protein